MGIIEKYVFPRALYCMSCGAIIDESRNYLLCDECIRDFQWNNGPSCKVCGKALGTTVEGIPDTCYDCMKNSHPFERGYSCLSYGSKEKKPILRLKYNDKGYLFRPLSEMLCDKLKAVIASEYYGEIPWDVIVPVPIHPRRLALRGYNQAELIARETSKELQLPMDTKILIRVKDTGKMNSMNPIERSANMEAAFEISKEAGDRSRVADKRILLVDDIYTTGATADACAQKLLEAGARSVQLATIATGANYFKE